MLLKKAKKDIEMILICWILCVIMYTAQKLAKYIVGVRIFTILRSIYVPFLMRLDRFYWGGDEICKIFFRISILNTTIKLRNNAWNAAIWAGHFKTNI